MGLPHAIVFDLAGTLWDTTEVVAQAWNSALGLAEVDRTPMTATDIASIMGLTHDQIFPKLFPDLSVTQREVLSHHCYQQEEAYIRRLGGRLYAGVRQGLLEWSSRLPLAIVSNCQSGYIELFLEWSGLGRCFVDWECHGNTGLSKAENIKKLLGRRSWTRALYVGDTRSDQEAAAQAGCDFVFASYGFGQATSDARSIDSFAQLDALWVGGRA